MLSNFLWVCCCPIRNAPPGNEQKHDGFEQKHDGFDISCGMYHGRLENQGFDA